MTNNGRGMNRLRRLRAQLAAASDEEDAIRQRMQAHPVEFLRAARLGPKKTFPVKATPVLDLRLEQEALAPVLQAAVCGERAGGFFYLQHHGISAALLARILRQTAAFHALPVEEKLRMELGQNGTGYLPHGRRILPTRETPNLNEAVLFKREHGPRDIRFPSDCRWPEPGHLPDFQPACEAYASAAEALAMKLLPVFALALGLPATHFEDLGAFSSPLWRLRLTHYPAVEPGGDAGYGIHPHVDTTFLTILHTSAPGLCYFDRETKQWVRAPPADAFPSDDGAPALLVNTGELLKRWSNDRIAPAFHFASNEARGASRYSVPFFFNATANFPLVCLPGCGVPKYAPQSYLESEGVTQGE